MSDPEARRPGLPPCRESRFDPRRDNLRVQGVLFDLDGTLVDTVEGIEWAFRRALAVVVPKQVVPDLRPFIGPEARDVLVAALPRLPDAQVAAVLKEFRRSYNAEGWRMSRLYPGVTDVLAKTVQLGIVNILVTNKPVVPAHNIVAGLGIEPFLHDMVCTDSREPAFADKTAMVSFGQTRSQPGRDASGGRHRPRRIGSGSLGHSVRLCRVWLRTAWRSGHQGSLLDSG